MLRRAHRLRSWVFGATIALAAAFGLVAFGRRVTYQAPWLGVEWVAAQRGIVALTVDRDGPAAAAGLLPGDRLVAVGGRPIVGTPRAGDLPWTVRHGEAVRAEVERGESVVSLQLRPERRRNAPAIYEYLALVGAAFLVSGAFVALRWPFQRGAWLYGLLGATLFLQFVASHTGRADIFDWVVHLVDVGAACLAPALLLHLAVVLSRRMAPSRKVPFAGYLVGAALAVAAVWLEGLGGMYRFEDPAVAVTAFERLQLAFLAAAVGLAVLDLALANARSTSSVHRGQTRWMLWGLGVGLAPFTLGYVVPWVLGAGAPKWTEILALPLLFVPAAFTAAMTRYRLHDLDLVLRRGMALVTLAVATVGVYVLALRILRVLLRDLELPADLLNFLTAIATAVLYPRLRQWVNTGVDRAFYRARYSYRATLLDWGRELNAETDLTPLLGRLEERIRETLDVPHACVLVLSGGRRFESAAPGTATSIELTKETADGLDRQPLLSVEADAIPGLPWARHLFGMKVKGRVRAVLAVAEREGAGQPLTTEDRALLVTLCSHTATAIEAARLVREVRQRAAEVERLKARQERILESSGVGLLLADVDGTILAWNRKLDAIYGMTAEEACGRRLTEVFPLHTVRALERRTAETGAGEDTRIYGHPMVNRRGERIVVNLAVSARVGTDAAADGARVVTLDDVTERVQLEEQMLRQERLAALGLLAAGVAHEVNTPLTGISSWTQMLLEDTGPGDRHREVLEKIEAQSRRASDIANSLLNMARPEQTPFAPLSLNDAVGEVVRLFEPQIRGRGIDLETRLDPILPEIEGRRGKLQQVLLNLLLNARDAVGGAGRIIVSTYARDGRVGVEVWDDGVGISEDDLPRIFDPFFTTKGRASGTGLGLSISYGIVREHAGEMLVESVPGEFTRFRVEIPEAGDRRAVAESGGR